MQISELILGEAMGRSPEEFGEALLLLSRDKLAMLAAYYCRDVLKPLAEGRMFSGVGSSDSKAQGSARQLAAAEYRISEHRVRLALRVIGNRDLATAVLIGEYPLRDVAKVATLEGAQLDAALAAIKANDREQLTQLLRSFHITTTRNPNNVRPTFGKVTIGHGQRNGRTGSNGKKLESSGNVIQELVRCGRRFGTILIDPWRVLSRESDANTWSVCALLELPIEQIMSANAAMYIAAPEGRIKHTGLMLDRFGFEECGLVLLPGPADNAVVLIGTTGDLSRPVGRNVIDRNGSSHHADQLRAEIMRVAPGPYVQFLGTRPKRTYGDWTFIGGD
jgi:hypothetical protein